MAQCHLSLMLLLPHTRTHSLFAHAYFYVCVYTYIFNGTYHDVTCLQGMYGGADGAHVTEGAGGELRDEDVGEEAGLAV